MKKSKALYEYLKAQGVFGTDKKTILLAKRQFRKKYKNKWAKEYRKHRHEIRFMLTKAEYRALKLSCNQKVSPTQTAKDLTLSFAYGNEYIPRIGELNTILRQLGLAINRLYTEDYHNELKEHLEEVEQKLLKYLNLNRESLCQ